MPVCETPRRTPPSVMPPSNWSEVWSKIRKAKASSREMSSSWRRRRRRKAARVRSSSGQVGSQGSRKARLVARSRDHGRVVRGRRRTQIEPVAANQRLRIDGSGQAEQRHQTPLSASATLACAGRLADRADRGDRRRRSKHGRAGFANLLDRDRLDPRDHLLDRKRAPVDLHLARELLGARARRFERGDQRHLHLRLGAADFRFARAHARPRPDSRARPRPPRRRRGRPSRRRSRTGRCRNNPSETNRSNRRGRASPALPGRGGRTCLRRRRRRRPAPRRGPARRPAVPRIRRRYASARAACAAAFRRRGSAAGACGADGVARQRLEAGSARAKRPRRARRRRRRRPPSPERR